MDDDARRKIEELFHRYAKGVSRYVRLRVGNAELAEEITARVFLTVVRSFHQQNGSTVGWLWAIVRSELGRHFRQRTHQAYTAEPFSNEGAPDSRLEQEERQRTLQDALCKLSDDDQQLLSLKFFLGLGNQEIAQALGLTPNHVGVKVHRALQELRRILANTEREP